MTRDTRSTPQRVADQYRTLAGLPENKGDSPTSDGDAQELTTFSEPDGGYGGKDGIKNTGAINASEADLTLQSNEQADALRDENDANQPVAERTHEQPKAAPKKRAAKKTSSKSK